MRRIPEKSELLEPVIRAMRKLEENHGSAGEFYATKKEVVAKTISLLGLPEEVLKICHTTEVVYRIGWALTELRKSGKVGQLRGAERNRWTLTEDDGQGGSPPSG